MGQCNVIMGWWNVNRGLGMRLWESVMLIVDSAM